jgi:hypothetical protein
VQLLREALGALDIDVEIELPYRFTTKGEMVAGCANRALLEQTVPVTMSCARPTVGRWEGWADPVMHCGYCVPCIIRRAALHRRLTDRTRYRIDEVDFDFTRGRNKGADLRAFRMALARYGEQAPKVADILRAGPIPGSDAELEAYLDMFTRGLNEVGAFLATYHPGR